ncbi:MAG: hypothetical protein IJ685_10345 [Selenomonadaceae bacterium]|nr:hypothetical protein [Selenomonadaceae bacterium]
MVINPGCIFVAKDALIFNVRAMSLRKFFESSEVLPENFFDCYPPDKITEINI